MFGSPIETIDYLGVCSFLETGVREGYALDFKRDFPSNLEKTLAAFANTYGGIILIGVDETSTGAALLPVTGIELRTGLRERVLQKSLDAIYPPLFPEVRVLEFKTTATLPTPDRAVIVVRVTESDLAPHAVDNRTTVYLRADNISDPFVRKATLSEVEWLANKRQRSSAEKVRIIRCATERACELRSRRRKRKTLQHYRGEGGISVMTIPTFPRAPLLDTRDWARTVQTLRVPTALVPHTLPNGLMQRVAEGVLFDGEYSCSEFQQQGLILHEFDYWWDYLGPSVSPGARQLYPDVTAQLMFSALELSRQLYRQVGYFGLLDFRFKADDLKDAFFADGQGTFSFEITKLIDSEIVIERRISVGDLEENLVNIAKDCQRELYWAFGVDATAELIAHNFRFIHSA